MLFGLTQEDIERLNERMPKYPIHSQECLLIKGDTGEYNLRDLPLVEQDYILSCPNPAHDSVRMIFGKAANE